MTLRLLLALGLALLLAPGAQAADLLTTDLRVSGKRAATCLKPASGLPPRDGCNSSSK